MKKLLAAIAPTLAAYAWRNRDSIRQWVDERRNGTPDRADRPVSVSTPAATATPATTTV